MVSSIPSRNLSKSVDIVRNNKSAYSCYEFIKCCNIKSHGYKDACEGGIFRQILRSVRSRNIIQNNEEFTYSYFFVHMRNVNSEDGEYTFSNDDDLVILKVDHVDFGISSVIDYFPVNYVNNIDFGYDIK